MGTEKQSYSDWCLRGKQKVQNPKFARTHVIMRRCLRLAGSGDDGGAPEHLCGSSAPKKKKKIKPGRDQLVDHRASGVLERVWLAVASQKQGQVCEWASSDWLSLPQKKKGKKKIGWGERRVFIGCRCLVLLVNGCLREWHCDNWFNWDYVRKLFETILSCNMSPFKDILSILFI